MRAEKLDREILQSLNRIGKAHFYDILNAVNESRKKRKTRRLKGKFPNMHVRLMSPTTLNRRLKFLVQTKAIEKVNVSHKNITYEVKEHINYIGAALIGSLAELVSVFGFTKNVDSIRRFVEKPFYDLVTIFPTLGKNQLEQLQVALTRSHELLEYYLDSLLALNRLT